MRLHWVRQAEACAKVEVEQLGGGSTSAKIPKHGAVQQQKFGQTLGLIVKKIHSGDRAGIEHNVQGRRYVNTRIPHKVTAFQVGNGSTKNQKRLSFFVEAIEVVAAANIVRACGRLLFAEK